MSNRIVRVVKLRRPIGSGWWFQVGRWAEGLGWTGRGRRFQVEYEEPHASKAAAVASSNYWKPRVENSGDSP